MIYWIPALVWMGIIFFLSGRTGDELHSLFPLFTDFNPGHVAAYYILALFYYIALAKTGHRRPYLKTIVLCLLYGITDEAHQSFVPTRYPDVYDLARDLVGTIMAVGTVFLVQKKLPGQKPDSLSEPPRG